MNIRESYFITDRYFANQVGIHTHLNIPLHNAEATEQEAPWEEKGHLSIDMFNSF